MTSQPSTLDSFIDAAADAVARAIAGLQRDAAREREIRDAEHRARTAELAAAIAAVTETERRLNERLASLKDGAPGASVTVDDVRPLIQSMVSDVVADLPVPERGEPGIGLAGAMIDREGNLVVMLSDGRSTDLGRVVGRDVDERALALLVETSVEKAVAAIPAPSDGRDGVDGKDADPVEIVRLLVPEVERRIVENPVFKGAKGDPGKDADPAVVRSMVEEAVAASPKPKDGRDGTPGADGKSVSPEDVLPAIEAKIAEAVAALPAPKDGKDGRDGQDGVAPTLEQVTDLLRPDAERIAAETAERIVGAWDKPKDGRDGTSVTIADVAPLIEEKIAEVARAIPAPRDGKDGKDGERGPVGPQGALPVAKAWEDRVYFQGELCVFDGATFQASRNTGKSPPHEDWTCLVARGRDGKDGRSFRVRATWSETEAEHDPYRALDVVALNGAAFVARKDDPGSCPGEDWQMIAAQGRPGKPGPAVKGDPGRPGPSVQTISVDDAGLLTLVNADGSVVNCDLYPVLSKLG